MHGSRLLRRGALLGAFASLAAVGLAVQVTAAATVTSLTSCGQISSPGTYRLDANITARGVSCFAISASNVRLILNGHTITSTFGADLGIFPGSGGSGDQIVGPGTVTGFITAGIVLGGGGGGSVRGVTASGNSIGILVGSGNSVRGNVATDNGFGIVAGSGGNTIIGNYAHGNFDDDLFDGNNACGSNVWRGNDFGTANESCIH
jgi:parallel beta-helix repeat protein